MIVLRFVLAATAFLFCLWLGAIVAQAPTYIFYYSFTILHFIPWRNVPEWWGIPLDGLIGWILGAAFGITLGWTVARQIWRLPDKRDRERRD